MSVIDEKINDYLYNAERNIQEMLFAPKADHPVWSDNLEIVQLAVQQILQPVGAFPDEKVLAFIGLHMKTAITGKRDSIGFLITNFRVLTQTDFSVIGTAKKAQSDLFTKEISAENIYDKAWNSFVIKNKSAIKEEDLASLRTALLEILAIILPELQSQQHLPLEIRKSTEILERVKELGLEDVLKNFSQDEKKFRIFSEKHNAPGIIAGVVDKPLFGGVYGLVITKSGLVSRDIFEDGVKSTWEEIKTFPAEVGNKSEIIFAGQKNHVVPSFQKEYVPAIITLLNEIAAGEVQV